MVGVALLFAMILGLLFVRRKQQHDGGSDEINPALVAPFMEQATSSGPPIPDSGLPAGWTLEQWAWYGEDYLKNQ
jgi:hypothetical protein